MINRREKEQGRPGNLLYDEIDKEIKDLSRAQSNLQTTQIEKKKDDKKGKWLI